MKGSKQSVKGDKRRGSVVPALPKKGMKVVDVSLTSKDKRAKIAAPEKKAKPVATPEKELKAKAPVAKKNGRVAVEEKVLAKNGRSPLQQKAAKNGTVQIMQAQAAEPTAKLNGHKAKTAKVVVEETPAPEPVAPESLSLELLRPFREAAKKNKKLQRERDKLKGRRSSFLAKPLKKGKKYVVDLRVHSPGSVGFFSTGGVDPAPALVRLAKVKGIDIVGLTDSFEASYIDEVKRSAEKSGVTIIPGVELCCKIADCNEISILALFPETFTGEGVYSVLAELGVPQSAFGRNNYSIGLAFRDVLQIIESKGGVVIPSRVDKTPFRHLAIPTMVEEFGIHAFDLIHPDSPEFFREHWPEGQFTFFSFSNANALGQIGSRTSNLRLARTGFEGIRELVRRRK